MNLDKKLELAHEYAMKHIQEDFDINYPVLVVEAWQYADAMEAEYNNRKQEQTVEDIYQDVGLFLNMADSPQLEQVLHDIDCYFDKTDNTQRDANNLIQSVYERLSGGVLNPSNSMELEWQPDWSVAPEWADRWGINSWVSSKLDPFWMSDDRVQEAPSFNYQGDWKDSLRKRPDRKPVPQTVETPPLIFDV